MWFCGIDIGTTHIKVVGITDTDKALDPVRVRTPSRVRNGLTVHCGEQVWSAVHDLVTLYAQEAASNCGSLGGLSVATFGQEESFGVDTAGRPVTESRAWWQVPESPALSSDDREYFDSEDHYRVSGLRYRPIQTPERLMQIRRQDPALLANIARWVDFGTYILHRLTGVWVSAANQVTRSQLFHVADLSPHSESFERLGVDPSLFAPIVPTGYRVGDLDPTALHGVDIAPRAGAYLGGLDQVVGALASQEDTGARAFDSIGTSEYVIALGSRFDPDPLCWELGVEIERGWGEEDFIYGFACPSGKILQMLARLLHRDDFDELMAAAAKPPVDTPNFSVGISSLDQTGSGLLDLTGIPADATPHAITRSVLDQLATRTSEVLTVMSRLAGHELTGVVLMGSLFRFEQMVEHRRLFWQLPLYVSALQEPVAIGAARVAAAAHAKET